MSHGSRGQAHDQRVASQGHVQQPVNTYRQHPNHRQYPNAGPLQYTAGGLPPGSYVTVPHISSASRGASTASAASGGPPYYAQPPGNLNAAGLASQPHFQSSWPSAGPHYMPVPADMRAFAAAKVDPHSFVGQGAGSRPQNVGNQPQAHVSNQPGPPVTSAAHPTTQQPPAERQAAQPSHPQMTQPQIRGPLPMLLMQPQRAAQVGQAPQFAVPQNMMLHPNYMLQHQAMSQGPPMVPYFPGGMAGPYLNVMPQQYAGQYTGLTPGLVPANAASGKARDGRVGGRRRQAQPWTKEEDKRLLAMVAQHGAQNWRVIANGVGSRTPAQAAQRWRKTLDPSLKKVKKGKWTADEDDLLRELIEKHGDKNWHTIAKGFNGTRTVKHCRERWVKHISPELKSSEPWTVEEDALLLRLRAKLGYNGWAEIARSLPGRTDNAVKRRFRSLDGNLETSTHIAF